MRSLVASLLTSRRPIHRVLERHCVNGLGEGVLVAAWLTWASKPWCSLISTHVPNCILSSHERLVTCWTSILTTNFESLKRLACRFPLARPAARFSFDGNPTRGAPRVFELSMNDLEAVGENGTGHSQLVGASVLRQPTGSMSNVLHQARVKLQHSRA